MITINDIDKNEVLNLLAGYRGNFIFLVKLRKQYFKLGKPLSEKQFVSAAKCLKAPSYMKAALANRVPNDDPEKAKVEDAILNYTGDFSFIISLRNQIKAGKTLSDKQLVSAAKCLTPKEKKRKLNEVVEGLNTPIVVKRWIARSLQRENGFDFAPFTFLVTKFHGQSKKAIKITATLNGGDVAVCRCCGKKLDTETSKATGLGPICAKKLGIKYITNKSEIARFKVELAEKVKAIGEMTFWLPKSQIKEGEQLLRNDLKISRMKSAA